MDQDCGLVRMRLLVTVAGIRERKRGKRQRGDGQDRKCE
jgi:hypothetical protein